MTNMFENEPDEFKLDDFVGDGKTYATPDDAAKALWHSQNHIKKIEAELAEARANKFTQQTTDELKRLIAENNQQRSNSQHEGETPSAGQNSRDPNDTVDIERQLENFWSKKQQETTYSQNIDAVRQQMLDYFGDTATATRSFNDLALENGMTPQELTEFAGSKPKAFARLAGLTGQDQRPVVNAPAQTRSNPSVVDKNIKPGTQAYYLHKLATDKSVRDNPAFYQEAIDAAMKNPKFFD